MDYLSGVWQTLESYTHLGERVLTNGTRLIGHAPHRAPEAWLHAIFAPIGDQEVDLIESAIGRILPEEFNRFLHRNNGISIFSSSLYVFGWRENFVRTGDAVWQPFSILTPNVHERPKDAESSFVFFGGYRYDASLLYIDSDDDSVYRCSRYSARPLNNWMNFPMMLESETERISKLFDREGRPLNPGMPATPS